MDDENHFAVMFDRTPAILVCACDELNQGSGARKEGKAPIPEYIWLLYMYRNNKEWDREK